MTAHKEQTTFWKCQDQKNLVVIVSRIIHVKVSWRLNVTNKFQDQRRLSIRLAKLSCFLGHPVLYVYPTYYRPVQTADRCHASRHLFAPAFMLSTITTQFYTVKTMYWHCQIFINVFWLDKHFQIISKKYWLFNNLKGRRHSREKTSFAFFPR